MDRLAHDPWFQAIGTLQTVVSIGALIFLISRWRRNGELLPYEPRRPVPWGPAGALLALAFTAVSVLSALSAGDASIDFEHAPPQRLMVSLSASMLMQSLGPMLLLFIAAASRANWSDVGLPSRSATAWARDAYIGVLASLGAIVPVGFVNFAAHLITNQPNELTKHPLVEMLTKAEPDVMVLALSTVMAVIVAPIAEEITFRLLLQGWLEKWEDRQIGWRCLPFADSSTREAAESENGSDAPPEFADLTPPEPILSATAPPKRGVGGLPHGWAPIIVSSLLFAVAHVGYGPEPVPLFVLALVLGYCYQRTHRIIPSIVAHGLFNLWSMIALWRVVFLNAG